MSQEPQEHTRPQHILVVEDDFNLRSALSDTLSLAGYQTHLAETGEEAMTACGRQHFSAVVSDINLPGMDGHTLLDLIRKETPETPVILITGYADAEKAVAAMRAGASDYLVKPFPAARLLKRLQSITHQTTSPTNALITQSPSSLHVKKLADRVSPTMATVLITGESGTGKEVMAQYIHHHSERHKKPFVAINCAALPDTMLESILFGHEKGAFTGANNRYQGKFEQANGGTLFLDEIAEMPLPQQAKLLRAIQEKEIERLGGHQPIPIDVRMIAATNQDLNESVQQGCFRSDLYYRLNVFPLHLPALRDRKEDIKHLAHHLLQRHRANNLDAPEQMTEKAVQVMEQYHWPGNIRELDNMIQRACVVATGAAIDAHDLILPAADPSKGGSLSSMEQPSTPTQQSQANSPEQPTTEAAIANLDNLTVSAKKKAEYQLVLTTLKQNHGHRNDTAAALGITPRMLRYKLAQLRELGIPF